MRPVEPFYADGRARVDPRTTSLLDFDLAKVTFCDISGYRSLLPIAQIAQAVGLNVRMHSASPPLRRVAAGLEGSETPLLFD